MRELVRRLPPVLEAVIIIAVFAGWFIYLAAESLWHPQAPPATVDDAFGLSLIIFESVAFAIAAGVLYLRGWKAQDFAFSITGSDVVAALALVAVAFVLNVVLWELAGKYLDRGAFVFELSESLQLSLWMAALVSVVNGTFEEFFLCRYLIERFKESGAAFAITLSAFIRMSYHIYQGPHGTLWVLALGLIFGAYFWRTRALGSVVLAHVLLDLFALT